MCKVLFRPNLALYPVMPHQSIALEVCVTVCLVMSCIA